MEKSEKFFNSIDTYFTCSLSHSIALQLFSERWGSIESVQGLAKGILLILAVPFSLLLGFLYCFSDIYESESTKLT